MPVAFRVGHSAVWTGQEMNIWAGADGGSGYDDGARYDPATDAWTVIPPDPGSGGARGGHTAVWTGSEMIIWGGVQGAPTSTGSRYDPVAGTWTPTSGTNVPSSRTGHTAVWTGSEMIVWGGNGNTGGRYDPVSDSWQPTSLGSGVPSGRNKHTAVWTGSEMVVWGGSGGPPFYAENTGGRYDPTTDSWRETSTGAGVPIPEKNHVAVWTGSRMLVWGGAYPGMRTIGRYDPVTDAWEYGFPGLPPLGEDVLAAKPPGDGGAFYSAVARGYRVDGGLTPTLIDAFPAYVGRGASPAVGDVDAGGDSEALMAPGPAAGFPPEVRGFRKDATPIAGLDFFAYGSGGFGANVATGTIDWGTKILTGPGPSGVFGPHVRAFRYAGGSVFSVSKVSFFAYGTLRFGVNVAAGDLDGDGIEEMVTGAGPGAVFGPHVRGFTYDGSTVRAMAKVSFFAYGTLKYGARVASGDVDADGYAELVTGPGPSAAFGAHLRGFDYDGAAIAPAPGINAIVFASTHGLDVAAGDLDGDGRDEIVCGAGPDPQSGNLLAGFDYDGARIDLIALLGTDVYGSRYGLRVAVGGMGF